MRELLIDTDTASDDAVALMMALAHPDVRVQAITTVAGNVSLAQASINARFTVELCRTDVPVFEGCDRPWLAAPAPADWYHGADGMSDRNYPPPARAAATGHAVKEIVRRVRDAEGSLELVTLGPLTNIATALVVAPEMATLVKRCWIMGGAACTHGNVTAAAEYNLWCDPEAARRVFDSGMPITMIGWEHSCNQATLDETERDAIHALGNEAARVAIDCNATAVRAACTLQAQSGLALADPVAMAVALEPSIATVTESRYVEIITGDGRLRGMSLVDRLGASGQTANAEVVFAIDAAAWKTLLSSLLVRYNDA